MEARRARFASILLLGAVAATGCTTRGVATPTSPSGSTAPAPVTLRLGFQADLTQAGALVGIQDKVFANALGPGATLTAIDFKAGPDEAAALQAGTLDAAYLDPVAAIAANVATNGGVRIISGAASGGAFLMTKYAIKTPADLRGQKIAVAQAANTADVALRTWLKSQGLNPGTGGSVGVVAMTEPSMLAALKSGSIAGAWVPEPWASELQVEDGAKVFLDEASLWPSGKYPTAVLAVRTAFLVQHPDTVANLLVGQVASNDLVARPSGQIEKDALAGIKGLTGVTVSQAVADLSWLHVAFTDDPLAAAVAIDASHALALGVIPRVPGSDLVGVGPLNSILKAGNEPQVSAG